MAKYYSVEEVQELLWDFIKASGGISPAAKALDVELAYLYQYVRGDRAHGAPSPRLVQKFGLQKITAYVGPDFLQFPPLSPAPAEKETSE